MVPKAAGLTPCSPVSPQLGSQVFLMLFAVVSELCLLTAMSIDHYPAVCDPLLCKSLMRKSVYVQKATL